MSPRLLLKRWAIIASARLVSRKGEEMVAFRLSLAGR